MELIRFAIMPLSEAKTLQDQLRKQGVEIVLNHNDQTCTRGCSVTVEVTGRQEDVPLVSKIYHENFKKLTEGLEVNWEVVDSVFDPNAEKVTCPACAFEFVPTSSECPDCGLTFI